MKVQEYIKETTTRGNKNEIRFFIDIENYKYNCKEGRKKPSFYKSYVYSLEVGFYYDNVLYTQNYVSFKQFFDDILNNYNIQSEKKNKNIYIVAHNGNKYDFHYLRYTLITDYNCKVYNEFLKNALENTNPLIRTENPLKDYPDIISLTPEDKEACILEKRVKSKSNLSMSFFLSNIKFITEDTWVKTNMSLRGLGKKLVNLGLISESEEKKTMDYTKYDLDQDLTDQQALSYAKKINKSLTPQDKLYIKNDIVVLANVYKNYEKLFPNGFKYSKITFTQNILSHYLGNDYIDFITQYQLLQKVQSFRKINIQLKNSDYQFNHENYYHYLKHFYHGGLNMYNDRYLGQIIKKPCFSIDINSSYPYVMYAKKVPTFLVSFKEKDTLFTIDTNLDDNYFYCYKVPKIFLNTQIEKIDSRVVKDMLIKYYYTIDDFSYINTNTIRIFKDIFNIEIPKILCQSYIKYACYHFNSRNKIKKLYGAKEQGKSDVRLSIDDPLNIKRTKHPNKVKMSKEEMANTKVLLNGLYGIPALRAYFNLFRYNGTSYINYEQGYQNSERNLIFSIFVTSYALYNLVSPLKYLKPYEIDKKFLYCDTDSLYFINDNDCILKKIPKKFLNDYNLGAFSLDTQTISHFYILNHKKYAYMDKGKIVVKCGGVPLESFNTDTPSFADFINKQFYPGKELETNHHILTEQGTMVIYQTTTNLDIGKPNIKTLIDPQGKKDLQSIFNQVKNLSDLTLSEIEYQDGLNGALYIETPYGAYSIDEVLYTTMDSKLTTEKDLNQFLLDQEEVISFLA